MENQLTTVGTDSSALSIAISSLDLDQLPARLNDQQLATLDEISSSTLPALPPVTDDVFAKCFRILAKLPRRKTDDSEGDFDKRLYRRMLGHYPDAAFMHLAEQALIECDFFPTVKRCIEIIERWGRPDEAYRSRARAIARREHQARFDELLIQIRDHEFTDEQINALPDYTKRVAETVGYLRLEFDPHTETRSYFWVRHPQSAAPALDPDERRPAPARENSDD